MEPHYFFRVSLALSVVPLLFGINGMLRPEAHLKSLEFPLPTEPQARRLSYALVRIWAIRNLCVGFLLSLIWTTGNEKLMAWGLGAGMAMATTDGFVSRLLIGGGETQHWVFPPIIGVVMAGLHGWFD